MKRLSRLLYLIQYLSARFSVPVMDLARLCGVSTRTIFRDIGDIHQAGFPVYYHNGYHVMRSAATASNCFTVGELKSLVSILCQTGEHGISLCDDRLHKMARLVSYSGFAENDFEAFSTQMCLWYRRIQNREDKPLEVYSQGTYPTTRKKYSTNQKLK